MIASCEWAETDGPKLSVEFANGHWRVILWRFEASFPSGCRLQALESHEKHKGKHLRKIVFRYMKADGELIFQVDPHQHAIPFDDPPHLHIGPTQDNRVEEGDWALNGYSLRGFDFIKMWELVLNYENDGSVPWRL